MRPIKKLVFLGNPGKHMTTFMQEAKDKGVFGSFCNTFNDIKTFRKEHKPGVDTYLGVDVDGKLMFLNYNNKVDEYLAQAEDDPFGMTASQAVESMLRYFV